ncbi:MAG: hypothetical protein WAM91_02970 [Candidatus Acidiferrales bacterium]
MKRSLALIAVALLVCAAGHAQQATGGWVVMPDGATPQQAGIMGKIVKNSPYSAKQVHERTQTLSDGTHINTTTTTTVCRDSSGRTRTEVNDEIATIVDPVNGATYRLNMKAQTATTIRTMNIGIAFDAPNKAAQDAAQADLQAKVSDLLPRVTLDTAVTETGGGTVTVTTTGGRGGAPLPNNGEFTTESLGTQTIEGLVVEGTRNTHTILEGTIGNDRPIKTVVEQWYSPDLQLYVMTKTSDPRNGENVMRLTEVSRNEPDASLFQIPANYKVVGGVGGGGGGGRRGQ